MGAPQETLDAARAQSTEATDRHVRAVAAVTEARAVHRIAAGEVARDPNSKQAQSDLRKAVETLASAGVWEVGCEVLAQHAREAVVAAEAARKASSAEGEAAQRAADVAECAELLSGALSLESSARDLRSKMAAVARRHGAAEAAWDVEARGRADAFANDVRKAAGLPQVDGNGRIIESATEQRS